MWSWRPTATRKVDLPDVERTVSDAHRQFQFTTGLCDPWQGDLLITRLNREGVPLESYPFTAPTHDAMARHLLAVFTDRIVELYDHPHLIRELQQMRVKEKTSGRLQIDHPRTSQGHGDHATAFTLALLAAKDAGSLSVINQFDPTDFEPDFSWMGELAQVPPRFDRRSSSNGSWG